MFRPPLNHPRNAPRRARHFGCRARQFCGGKTPRALRAFRAFRERGSLDAERGSFAAFKSTSRRGGFPCVPRAAVLRRSAAVLRRSKPILRRGTFAVTFARRNGCRARRFCGVPIHLAARQFSVRSERGETDAERGSFAAFRHPLRRGGFSATHNGLPTRRNGLPQPPVSPSPERTDTRL